MASPATQPPPWTCPRLKRLTSLLSSGALSHHLGLLLGGEEQEALPQAPVWGWGGWGSGGKRCRKVEASGKGMSETAVLGAGALEQTREVGGGCGAACSHVRPTWATPVTVSALHRRASGQHVPGFRLRDRNPSVNPSSRGARAVRVAAEANQRRAGGRLTAMHPTKQEGRTLPDTGSGAGAEHGKVQPHRHRSCFVFLSL